MQDEVDSLLGEQISRVGLEPWAVELLLGAAALRVEGPWVFHDAGGAVIDREVPLESRTEFHLWRAVGRRIAAIDYRAEEGGLTLSLDDGSRLDMPPSNTGYEDWLLLGPTVFLVGRGRETDGPWVPNSSGAAPVDAEP